MVNPFWIVEQPLDMPAADHFGGRQTVKDGRIDKGYSVTQREGYMVGMEAYAGRTMDKMSDGECQRIMIARALAQETPVILLDEPTSFLDMPNRYELCSLLARLAHAEGKCILFSTHELDIALSLSDRIALIDTPVLHCLPTSEMIRNKRHVLQRIRGCQILFGTPSLRLTCFPTGKSVSWHGFHDLTTEVPAEFHSFHV